MKVCISLGILLFALVSAGTVAASGAPIDNPPQFIILGSDDNTSAEGMDWIVEYLASKEHADGTPLRMSFYSNTGTAGGWVDRDGEIHNQELVDAHARAYQNGHEVSCHGYGHPHYVSGSAWERDEDWNIIGDNEDQIRFSKEEIREDIEKNLELLQLAGVPREHMRGFRTPYLAFSDSVFSVVRELGFEYDCSVTESQGGPAKHVWPYDMADGIIEGSENSWWITEHDTPVRSHPGLWQLPAYSLEAHPDDWEYLEELAGWNTTGQVTGLDWNMWAEPEGGVLFNKEQSINALKHTLDEKLNGTRAPMAFGMHSQYYVDDYDAEGFPNVQDSEDRRAIIEAFIDYALTKENVWFVNGAQVFAYMNDPVSADEFNPDDYAWSIEEEDNEAPTDIRLSNTVIEEGQKSVGTVTVIDQPGDVHTIEVVSGPFSIDNRSLYAEEDLAVGTYTLILKATDQGGLSLEKEFTIEVVEPAEYTELIGMASWEGDFDGYDTGSDAVVEEEDGIVSMILTQGESDGDENEWAWASGAGYIDGDLEGITHIEVVYSATKNITLGLGTGTYGYNVSLEAGEEKTLRVAATEDEFSHVWGPEDFDLADFSGVSFGTAEEGSVEIQLYSVKLFGYSETSLIEERATQPASLAIGNVHRHGLSLSTPRSGSYTIGIYTADGRRISTTQQQLSAGVSEISFDQRLSSNVVVVRITGEGLDATARYMLR